MSSSTRLRLRSCLPRTHTLTLRVRITARAHAEVRVCSNKTCRKQTSAQTLALMTDAAPLDIHVDSCGCLGNCGNGPNVLVLNRETAEETVVNHVSTPAQAAKLLASLTSIDEQAFYCCSALTSSRDDRRCSHIDARRRFSRHVRSIRSGQVHVRWRSDRSTHLDAAILVEIERDLHLRHDGAHGRNCDAALQIPRKGNPRD